MRLRLFLAVFVVLAAAVPAVAQDTVPAQPTTVPEMWNAWCSRCHSRDGTGKVAEPTITVEPLNFTECRIATAEPDADWRLAISKGGPAVGLSSQMPAFGDVLNDAQIDEFIALIRAFCAERNWPSGNFNLPRPIFAEKPFPEDELVLAPVASHHKDEPTSYGLAAIFERRIGRRAQLEAVFPIDSVPSGQRETGIGDVELGFKYALTPHAPGYLLTAGMDFVLPTGSESRGLGEGTAGFEPYLAFATTAGSAYVQGQVKLELPRRRPWEDHVTVYNFYVGRDTGIFPDTWTVGMELNGENEEVALTPQVRKGLTRTGALAAAVGVRLPVNKREEQGIQWVGYLLWEFLEPVRPRR